MPAFRTAYLIHGDDHGRIAERRARLRAMAEDSAGTAGVEVFEGDACTPEAIEVGRGNTYGHPTPSTLAALRAVPNVYRTDRDGTVRLRVHDGAMTVERAP